MDSMTIADKMYELSDKEYADFNSKLIPNVPRELVIGVRVPQLRKLSKEMIKNSEEHYFIEELPHKYYEENMLHGLIVSEINDYSLCIEQIEKFLPYVDNWAVCDSIIPKVFEKNREELMKDIRKWLGSQDTYTIRFGLKMLMTHFLDENFKEEYLKLPLDISSEEYYVKMMKAWYYATALAKRWDETLDIIKEEKLDVWVHNKAIQKARESRRITEEQKELLKNLKR